ncbi:DUF5819 family protein [Stigmatella sp. ncwal1]|uniref:DUF5819 family protein n=1 Tax=Stigmatella ashevillensis TaxID=2995309 RepID=A0ABT5DFG2_9BACT|nr:DUF5819 family protein [Stigmatella ashevillena]MDC0711062.1 DUF5819 family protein [Stigmatella ashevillena]
MKNPRTTLAWVTAGLVVLCLHWAAIVISISNPNPIRERFGAAADFYVGPLFFQKWRLFSPDPGTYSKKFLYRCRLGVDGWTDWRSPVDELLESHYRLRVTHHGRLLRIPISFALGLAQEAAKTAREQPCAKGDEACVLNRDGLLRTRPIYLAALRYTRDRCDAEFRAAPQPLTAAQFKLALMNIPSPTQRAAGVQVPPSHYTFDPFEIPVTAPSQDRAP